MKIWTFNRRRISLQVLGPTAYLIGKDEYLLEQNEYVHSTEWRDAQSWLKLPANHCLYRKAGSTSSIDPNSAFHPGRGSYKLHSKPGLGASALGIFLCQTNSFVCLNRPYLVSNEDHKNLPSWPHMVCVQINGHRQMAHSTECYKLNVCFFHRKLK